MSTKIYEAYEWHGTMPELMELFKELREKYVKAATDSLCTFYTITTADSDEKVSIYKEVTDSIRKGYRDVQNIEASFAVYFLDERVLFQPFGLSDLKVKIEHEKLKDYCYWNNVDEPEGMSEEEWDERAETWDRVFDGSGIPTNIGLIYELSNRATVFDICSRVNRVLNMGEPKE